MGPAATLSILVKAQGAAAAATQLTELDAAAKRTSGQMDKASGAAKKHSGVLSGLGKAAGVAGVAMGAVGLAKAVKTATSEYREAQKVGAQTNAVLKSTGNAANVSKSHIQDLATAISKKSGIDDEAIQSGENLLLTFTNIRNETGKGNKIFDQATQVVTDMSVALGQSGKSSAIQLGKALQDPIKGVTALRRVGVMLTTQQQDQIKTLVQHGHTLDAQKLILRELTKEFGGSAAAQATAGDKLKVALSNLAEAAGSIVVPALDKIATFMTNVINQFVEGEGIARFIIPAFQAFATIVGTVYGSVKDLIQGFKDGNTWAVIIGGTILALTAGFVAYYTATRIAATYTWALTKAQAALDAVAAANPWVVLVVTLVALGTALVIAYNKSEKFRDAVNNIGGALASVPKAISGVASAIAGAFTSALNFIIGLPGRVAKIGYNIGASIVNGILNGVAGLAGQLVTSLENSLVAALNAVNPFSPVEHGGEIYIGRPLAEGAIQGWIDGSQELPTKISQTVRDAVDKAKGTLDGLRSVFGDAWGRLATDALSAFDAIQGQKQTPTEKLLAGIMSQRDIQALQDRVNEAQGTLGDAQAALADAVAGGDPQKIADAQKQVLNAQKQLDDALWEQRKAGLEKQAAAERKELDAQNALKRRHFSDALDALKTSLGKEGATRVQAHHKVMALFKKFGVDYKTAGTASGEAFATGLKESETGVDTAAANIHKFLLNLPISEIVKQAAEAGKKAAEAAKKGAAKAQTPKTAGASLADSLKAVPKTGLPEIPKIPKLPTQADIKPLKLSIDTSQFTKPLQDAWDKLTGIFNWVTSNWSVLGGALLGPFQFAAGEVIKHIGSIKTTIVGAFNATIGAIHDLASTFKDLGSWVINRIVEGAKATIAGLLSIGGWLKNRVMDGLTAVTDAVQSLGGWVINRVVDGAKATTAGLLTVGGWIKNRVFDGLNAVVDTIQGLGGWIINRVVEGIRATTQGLLDIGGWLKNRLLEGLSSVKDGIMGLGGSIIGWIVDGLKAGAIKVQDFLNDIIDVINKLPMVEIKHIAVIGKAKGGAYGSGPIPAGLAKGGAFARTGGKVTSPITLMGEEAPRYPEYVIPTNPAYRNRAGGLLGQAASALGFAAGGVYSKDDLKKLWISQQGNPLTANVAAAVALAESGGRAGISSSNPAGGINMGLWQIWSGNPGATFDPAGNARTAIRMSRNGTDWGQWEAFTNGNYKQFLGSGLDAIGGLVGKVGGIVGDLLSKGVGFLLDQLPGTGRLPDWLKGTGKYILDHVTGWVKDKVSGILGSLSGGSGETSTSGLVPQVKRAVDWARSHGWHGTVTSGFRSYSEQAALYARYLAGGNLAAKPGTSSHETGQAVDVTDPAGFARALMNAPAMSKIYNRLGAADPVHFSVSGYKMGGVWPFVGSYATGGVVPQTGLAMVHKGETISPAGATTVVEHHYHGPVVQDKDFIQYLRNIDKNYGRQNGRPAFGG